MKNSDPWLDIMLTLYNSVALPDDDVERERTSEGFPVNVGM